MNLTHLIPPFLRTLSLVLTICTPLPQAAASSIRQESPHYRDNGWEVSIGPGMYLDGDDIFLGGDVNPDMGFVLLTEISYQYDNFYFMLSDKNGFYLGYSLLRDKNWVLDTILVPRFVRPDNPEFHDLEERGYDFHGGFKLSRYGDRDLISVELSQDISGRHNGQMFIAQYLREFQLKNWLFTAGTGAVLASHEMTDYYFGVTKDEAATSRFPVYHADASQVYYLQLSAEYPINERWVYAIHASLARFSSQIHRSPVAAGDSSSILETGFRYRF